MKTAKFTKPLTIALHPEVFARIKQITDIKNISIAEWVRVTVDAALLKIEDQEASDNE
jgi:hypothetical protein